MKSLKEYRFESNPKEREIVFEFLNKVKYANKGDVAATVGINEELSEREQTIVVSIVQWFATPVGADYVYNFIHENPQNLSALEFFELHQNSTSHSNIFTYREIITFGHNSSGYPIDHFNEREFEIFDKVINWLDNKKTIKFVEKYI